MNRRSIPNKRLVKHIYIFRQGELGHLVRDTMRNADGEPISTPEIVSYIVSSGGHGDRARKAIGHVRSNLAYLVRKGKVEKIGNHREARWLLT